MIDLVMWTLNGERTLVPVLEQIDRICPRELGQRIAVDDGSTDSTREILRGFGWRVVANTGSGIADGANTALRLVTSEFFASFEQDLLLSKDWLPRVLELMRDVDVAVVSGVRLPDWPKSVRHIQEFTLEHYRKRGVPLARTLDNTLYQTNSLRQIGGFPKLDSKRAGVDRALLRRVEECGLKWLVDYSLVSTHLRAGLSEELEHYRWYGRGNSRLRMLFHLLLSPLRGLQIAFQKRCPSCFFVYPLIRFNVFRGAVGF